MGGCCGDDPEYSSLLDDVPDGSCITTRGLLLSLFIVFLLILLGAAGYLIAVYAHEDHKLNPQDLITEVDHSLDRPYNASEGYVLLQIPDVQTQWVNLNTVKGDKGDTGATGATGSTGATGPAGPSTIYRDNLLETAHIEYQTANQAAFLLGLHAHNDAFELREVEATRNTTRILVDQPGNVIGHQVDPLIHSYRPYRDLLLGE